MTALVLAVALAWSPAPIAARDVALEATFAALLAVDAAQTEWMLRGRHPGITFEEQNPLLGRRPSTRRLVLYDVTAVVLHAAVAALLPRGWRETWQLAAVQVEVSCLVSNYRNGGIRLAVAW